MKTNYYLLKVIRDVEPELSGPFPTETERDNEALKHRSNDAEMKDGLFPMDIKSHSRKPEVKIESYGYAFFNPVRKKKD